MEYDGADECAAHGRDAGIVSWYPAHLTAGWELKWHSERTHLVTLFHKEADGPEAIMRYMVRRYGIRDAKGRRSFRTPSGVSLTCFVS